MWLEALCLVLALPWLFLAVQVARLCFADADLATATAPLPPDAFNDQVVWITGASSGIGEALAHAFALQGSRLILSSRRREVLEEVRGSLPCDSSKVFVLPLDLEDLDSLPGKAAEALQVFGHVDVLVNNGGVSTRCLARDAGFALDQRLATVDYLSHVCLAKAVLPAMIGRQKGHFINISSVAGKAGLPQRSAYSGAKAALLLWFEALGWEEQSNGIHVTNVCPGWVRTKVGYNALGADAKAVQQDDANVEKGMSPERCARLILGAAHAKLPEAWLSSYPPVLMMYVGQFLPPLMRLITRHVVVKPLLAQAARYKKQA